MSLYSTFTLKEWLSLNCNTKDVNDLFHKALRDNDQPMTVLAMSELIKRGDINLVVDAIGEAVDEEYINSESSFANVLEQSLKRFGDRTPILKGICKEIDLKGWPRTMAELLEGTELKSCERRLKHKTVAELLEGADLKGCERKADDRLDLFLTSFMRDGWFSVELGIFSPESEWDPRHKERSPINVGEYYSLVIKNGFVMNRDEIPYILEFLDGKGITKPLPKFDGVELDLYTLSDDGSRWVNVSRLEKVEENFFYTTYYCIGRPIG